MRRLRKQEPNSNFANPPPDLFERCVDSNPQRLQHIRAAALRTRRAVPVLGPPPPRRCRNNRRRRRNIKSPGIVPAGTASIHHPLRQRLAIRKNSRRVPPHHPRKSRQLLRPERPFIQRAKKL